MVEPNELAAFLRARRERLTPEDVGLPIIGRRRTPGLRREEVATLAGVSIDYLIRLEQGRDTNPSAEVIGALSNALQLSEAEMHHLAKLAACTNSPSLCPTASSLSSEVRPTITALLDQLDPVPAFVLNPINDVLGQNAAWTTIASGLGMLDDETPSLARFVFTHAGARDVYRDWETAADEQAGHLRSARARWGDDPRFVSLVDELQAVPDFVTRWDAHGVGEKRRGAKRLRHPVVGDLRFSYEVMELVDDDQRLISWQADDEATAARLAALLDPTERPAKLRVVGS